MKTKQLSLSVCLMLFISILNVQGQSLNTLFNKYGLQKEFELVSIDKPLLMLASAFVDKDTKKILSRMSGLKILTADNANKSHALMQDIQTLTKHEHYETLVEVREKGERVMIYFKEQKNKKTDILILTKDREDMNLIWFQGRLSIDDIKKMQTVKL